MNNFAITHSGAFFYINEEYYIDGRLQRIYGMTYLSGRGEFIPDSASGVAYDFFWIVEKE